MGGFHVTLVSEKSYLEALAALRRAQNFLLCSASAHHYWQHPSYSCQNLSLYHLVYISNVKEK